MFILFDNYVIAAAIVPNVNVQNIFLQIAIDQRNNLIEQFTAHIALSDKNSIEVLLLSVVLFVLNILPVINVLFLLIYAAAG